MRSNRKYKPNQKEQGDLALRMSSFSQFVTSSASPDTISLKSIKRMLGGVNVGRRNTFLLPKSWWLPMTGPVKVWCEVTTFPFHLASSRIQKRKRNIYLMWKYSFSTYQNAMHLHLKDIILCKQHSAVPRGNIWLETNRIAVIKNTSPQKTILEKNTNKMFFILKLLLINCLTILIIT